MKATIKDKYTFKQFQQRCPAALDNLFGEKVRHRRSEDAELVDVVAWFKYRWPMHTRAIMHPANEGIASHPGHRRELKNKGMLTGAHDVVLLLPSGHYGFATFELKRSDHSSSVSEEQIQVGLTNVANGGYVAFCWGFDSMKKAITEYMKMRSE